MADLYAVFDRLRHRLAQPIGNAPLAVWRIAFGTLMLLEAWGAIATGWVRRAYVAVDYSFPFMGFEFLGFLNGPAAYAWFGAMGVAALGVALGYRYRISAVLLAVLWSAAYLGQKTHYNNHYYLAMLLCWAMALVPQASERASFDASRRGTSAPTHPYWITLGAKLLLLIVFSYGAVAKLYTGWWNGDFIATGFAAKAHYPLIGPVLAWPAFQTFITFGAIAFDALVIPLLWWRPTRRFALLGLVAFNAFNSVVFQIGIFPYLVLAFTVFFFPPSTIERLFRLPPVAGEGQGFRQNLSARATFVFVGFLVVQALLPLRHHLLPGDVNWTEEGHRLSWRMMSRSKSGALRLSAVHPVTGVTEAVPPRLGLSPKQAGHVATKPDFLYQWVQRLKAYYVGDRGWPGVELYVRESRVYLNGRGPHPLFAEGVDLAAVDWRIFGHQAWVLDAPAGLYED